MFSFPYLVYLSKTKLFWLLMFVPCILCYQRTRNDATFSAGQWADSLMSVGDLLSEASKAANFGSTYAAPNPEQMQSSYDSFDAAIAAQIAGQQSPGSPTRLPQSIWHAEETCDGFSFRSFPDAKREDSNPLISSSNFVLRENTCTHSLAFEDYLKVCHFNLVFYPVEKDAGS